MENKSDISITLFRFRRESLSETTKPFYLYKWERGVGQNHGIGPCPSAMKAHRYLCSKCQNEVSDLFCIKFNHGTHYTQNVRQTFRSISVSLVWYIYRFVSCLTHRSLTRQSRLQEVDLSIGDMLSTDIPRQISFDVLFSSCPFSLFFISCVVPISSFLICLLF
jgi:hypothetical protein